MSNPIPKPDYAAMLANSGMPNTEEKITAEFERTVNASGYTTNTSKMSPFWRLIKAIVVQPVLWLQRLLAEVVLVNVFVATAMDKWLDLHAWAVNLTRKPATKARGVVVFYKEDAAVSITVKAGILIQTERINGRVYALMVTEDFEIPRGKEKGMVPVLAEDAGEAFNLSPGYYRILPEPISGIREVKTEEDWLLEPGADQESNDELRARIRTQFNVVGQYHIDAVYRAMIATVSGLSVDRVFFKHDAPRGPGTANAYLLLDTGVASQPFIDAVNDFITNKGNHGHGDDMRCFALPETRHALAVQVFVSPYANLSDEEKETLRTGVEQMIRCAFRENKDYDVTKTWPYDRFSFSRLGEELHQTFPAIASLKFSLDDIVSALDVPRLSSLTVGVRDD